MIDSFPTHFLTEKRTLKKKEEKKSAFVEIKNCMWTTRFVNKNKSLL